MVQLSFINGNVSVYKCCVTLNILFDEVERGLRHEKHILLDTICIVCNNTAQKKITV